MNPQLQFAASIQKLTDAGLTNVSVLILPPAVNDILGPHWLFGARGDLNGVSIATLSKSPDRPSDARIASTIESLHPGMST